MSPVRGPANPSLFVRIVNPEVQRDGHGVKQGRMVRREEELRGVVGGEAGLTAEDSHVQERCLIRWHQGLHLHTAGPMIATMIPSRLPIRLQLPQNLELGMFPRGGGAGGADVALYVCCV
jgi:hypothetical protein